MFDETTLEIKEIPPKGKGVFTNRAILKGTKIFHLDPRALPRYTKEQIARAPELARHGDHSLYVGKSLYAIDLSLPSYINHSCSPNCYEKMVNLAVKDIYALVDIEPGEELTLDYTLTAVDQFAGQGFWKFECNCGSDQCRGTISGDFLAMPDDIQAKYYKNLPPSILDLYKERFARFYKN